MALWPHSFPFVSKVGSQIELDVDPSFPLFLWDGLTPLDAPGIDIRVKGVFRKGTVIRSPLPTQGKDCPALRHSTKS
eukprot:6354724-Amphidinium_carterae.1